MSVWNAKLQSGPEKSAVALIEKARAHARHTLSLLPPQKPVHMTAKGAQNTNIEPAAYVLVHKTLHKTKTVAQMVRDTVAKSERKKKEKKKRPTSQHRMFAAS